MPRVRRCTRERFDCDTPRRGKSRKLSRQVVEHDVYIRYTLYYIAVSTAFSHDDRPNILYIYYSAIVHGPDDLDDYWPTPRAERNIVVFLFFSFYFRILFFFFIGLDGHTPATPRYRTAAATMCSSSHARRDLRSERFSKKTSLSSTFSTRYRRPY